MKIINGDCIEELAKLDENSVDSIVCDPPYAINFMGKAWDGPEGMLGQMATGDEQRGAYAYGGSHSQGIAANDSYQFQEWCRLWGEQALRVLKPGGHILAFGHTRTYHRLASGLEDAGFEIRDCIQWLYGSGFPKSHNVAKAIDKKGKDSSDFEGWGTTLKPANEPIVMARKPFKGTVADNVLKYGVGALNIDATRVGTSGPASNRFTEGAKPFGNAAGKNYETTEPTQGRWPANVILDEEAGQILDEQTGTLTSGKSDGFEGDYTADVYGKYEKNIINPENVYGDSGGASRFFYSAKAAPKEKNAGIEKEVENDRFKTRQCTQCKKNVPYIGSCGCENAEIEMVAPKPTKNTHPTVKPIDLMRYLVRLVTPKGGIVVDPFLGSGTTGIAAQLEGFDFIGIEKDLDSFEIAYERINWWKDKSGDTKVILKENL
jgi:DNA modification methylase